jgi:hypothetical protein
MEKVLEIYHRETWLYLIMLEEEVGFKWAENDGTGFLKHKLVMCSNQ